jgi:ABC-type sugar transport system ATPase subunit
MTLAHRMVVMDAGHAEQIGSTMEVYADPATRFVAGFIGTPAMNFLPGKGAGAGKVALDGGGIVQHTQGVIETGRPVVVGIRPEHLVPCAPADACITGTVEMVEQLGADTLVHVGHGGALIVVRLSQVVNPVVGSAYAVTADPARVFLFDSATGVRVRT